MKFGKACVSVIAISILALGAVSMVFAQAQHVRWDLVSINFAAGTVSPGGVASARAADHSKITLTGSGTFVAPAGGRGSTGAATGGGTWTTHSPVGVVTGGGTYWVTGLVRWDKAPGTPPPLRNLIGDPREASAGLVILQIEYSDGSRGILVVSCHLIGTPDSVFEGITASKGFVDYYNAELPAPGVDANRTLFHVRN